VTLVGEILKDLESRGNPENIAGLERFGIKPKKAFGIKGSELKLIARPLKKRVDRHKLASGLWATQVHEARILAYLIDDPKQVTSRQMDRWVRDFDNWAICDSACGHLFSWTDIASQKALEWSAQQPEFIKRAGIVLMAWLTVHDKTADEKKFQAFLPVLESLADDDRTYVKKAVSWSVRQIGKRSIGLNRVAVETAERIRLQGTRSAKWIAADALRELGHEKTLSRLRSSAILVKNDDLS
jgi:3-methyladenine DNA glycosylase AlkD